MGKRTFYLMTSKPSFPICWSHTSPISTEKKLAVSKRKNFGRHSPVNGWPLRPQYVKPGAIIFGEEIDCLPMGFHGESQNRKPKESDAREKGGFVSKGIHQKRGIYFKETLATIAYPYSICQLFANPNSKGLPVTKFDENIAFLNRKFH